MSCREIRIDGKRAFGGMQPFIASLWPLALAQDIGNSEH